MNVLLILILASLGMALFFLGVFIWAVRSGQYEDTTTPSMRVLMEEDQPCGRSQDQKAAAFGTKEGKKR